VYPLHFYKRGLRDEILKEHYGAATVSANINPVYLRVLIGCATRMDVSGKGVGSGVDLLKKIIKAQK
jgi:hypothetical protein